MKVHGAEVPPCVIEAAEAVAVGSFTSTTVERAVMAALSAKRFDSPDGWGHGTFAAEIANRVLQKSRKQGRLTFDRKSRTWSEAVTVISGAQVPLLWHACKPMGTKVKNDYSSLAYVAESLRDASLVKAVVSASHIHLTATDKGRVALLSYHCGGQGVVCTGDLVSVGGMFRLSDAHKIVALLAKASK